MKFHQPTFLLVVLLLVMVSLVFGPFGIAGFGLAALVTGVLSIVGGLICWSTGQPDKTRSWLLSSAALLLVGCTLCSTGPGNL